jgi:hypothetical protein
MHFSKGQWVTIFFENSPAQPLAAPDHTTPSIHTLMPSKTHSPYRSSFFSSLLSSFTFHRSSVGIHPGLTSKDALVGILEEITPLLRQDEIGFNLLFFVITILTIIDSFRTLHLFTHSVAGIGGTSRYILA